MTARGVYDIEITNVHVKLKMGPLMSFFFFKLKLNDAQGRIGILFLWADKAGQRILGQGQGVSPRPGDQLQHKLTITSNISYQSETVPNRAPPLKKEKKMDLQHILYLTFCLYNHFCTYFCFQVGGIP